MKARGTDVKTIRVARSLRDPNNRYRLRVVRKNRDAPTQAIRSDLVKLHWLMIRTAGGEKDAGIVSSGHKNRSTEMSRSPRSRLAPPAPRTGIRTIGYRPMTACIHALDRILGPVHTPRQDSPSPFFPKSCSLSPNRPIFAHRRNRISETLPIFFGLGLVDGCDIP